MVPDQGRLDHGAVYRTDLIMATRRADRVGAHRTAFEKNRLIILATQNVCGICGREIDPSFKYPHPLSATVDHIIPVAKGGHPSELSNLQAAHRCCNRWKSDRLVASRMKGVLQDEDENAEKIINLPQHYDWASYRPKTGKEQKENVSS